MNPWFLAALALLPGFIICSVVIWRARLIDAVLALNLAAVLATLELVLLAEGIDNTAFYELALALAVLAPIGSLVFLRFLERWV